MNYSFGPAKVAVLLVLSIGFVACGGSSNPPTQSPSASDDGPGAISTSVPDLSEGTVIRTLASRHAIGSRERLIDSVLEAMPNVTFVGPEGPRGSMSDAVVVGSIVEVSPGVSATWDEEGTTRTLLPFNDPQAMASTIHVTLQIDQVVGVGSGIELAENVTFGLALGGQIDLEAASAELKGLGTVVPFLFKDSPVFDYDKSLYSVLEDGAFLGVVGPDGGISFPAMDPVAVSVLVPPDLTMDSLLSASSEPIQLPIDG